MSIIIFLLSTILLVYWIIWTSLLFFGGESIVDLIGPELLWSRRLLTHVYSAMIPMQRLSQGALHPSTFHHHPGLPQRTAKDWQYTVIPFAEVQFANLFPRQTQRGAKFKL